MQKLKSSEGEIIFFIYLNIEFVVIVMFLSRNKILPIFYYVKNVLSFPEFGKMWRWRLAVIFSLLPLAHGQSDGEALGQSVPEYGGTGDFTFYINKEDDVSREKPSEDQDEKIEPGKPKISQFLIHVNHHDGHNVREF